MDSFSGEKYKKVESLFSWREDLIFLKSQSGYTPAIGRTFRRARRNLTCRWLNEIRADFDRLYRESELILVDSPVDRPDLARELLRLRLQFYRNLIILRIRSMIGRSLTHEIGALTFAFENLIGYCLIADEEVRRLA